LVEYIGHLAEHLGNTFYFQPNGTACYLYSYKTDVGHPKDAVLTATRGSIKLASKSKKSSSADQKGSKLFEDDKEKLIRKLSLLTLMESELVSATAAISQKKQVVVKALLSRGTIIEYSCFPLSIMSSIR